MQESECKYVCSRGILKSCDIYSLQPISSIRQLINYDFSKCTNGSTIYICNSAIQHFLTVILPYLPFKIILVSGDSDSTCWEDIFSSYKEFLNFIENDKIIHWFSQNCIAKHAKISQIPIGLDYHTMSNNHPKWGPKLNPIEQENVLQNIINNPFVSKPFWEREIKCYSNFHFFMTTKHGYDRNNAFNNIPKQLVYYESSHILREDTWKKQDQYAFVISPHGGGLDCHRTWEALVLGCIPIVKTSGLDSLYTDLPVLIVKEWTDINEELLQDTISYFKNKQFNYDRLLLSYWMNLINEKKLGLL
jgi:hypothetical protein